MNRMNNIEYNDRAFEKLVNDFLDDRWKFTPTEATFEGVHDYDGEMDQLDENSIEEFLRKEEKYLSELKNFRDSGRLSPERMLDLEILHGYLRRDIAEDRHFNRYRRDPSVYINHAVFSCMALLIRDFAPKEVRLRALIKRLGEVPRLLLQGMDNLRRAETIPAVWIDIAVKSADAAQKFFSDIILNVSGEVEEFKNEILASATLASKAFKNYSEFLSGELSQKPKGDFAAGKEYFEFLLRDFHMLPYGVDEIEKIGSEYIEKTLDEIKKLAAEISPGKDWTEVIEEVKSDAPPGESLLNHYREEMLRTRDFIVRNDLVTIPDNESLQIVETPASHRMTLPYAAYLSAPPFEKEQRGIFWVTPVDSDAGETAMKEQLAGHSKAAIAVRTLHEGYPGHHLQFLHANRVDSKIRRIFGTPVFAEGWALYCEEMMREQGYLKDKKTRLIQLKDQLWRACRIVIDVRLHTGKYTFDEAVDLLVDVARLERGNAVAEVNRYTQSPTQPMSYLIGKIEIEALMRSYRGKFPDKSLKEIHNRLLSFGTIPVSLVRNSMLGTN